MTCDWPSSTHAPVSRFSTMFCSATESSETTIRLATSTATSRPRRSCPSGRYDPDKARFHLEKGRPEQPESPALFIGRRVRRGRRRRLTVQGECEGLRNRYRSHASSRRRLLERRLDEQGVVHVLLERAADGGLAVHGGLPEHRQLQRHLLERRTIRPHGDRGPFGTGRGNSVAKCTWRCSVSYATKAARWFQYLRQTCWLRPTRWPTARWRPTGTRTAIGSRIGGGLPDGGRHTSMRGMSSCQVRANTRRPRFVRIAGRRDLKRVLRAGECRSRVDSHVPVTSTARELPTRRAACRHGVVPAYRVLDLGDLVEAQTVIQDPEVARVPEFVDSHLAGADVFEHGAPGMPEMMNFSRHRARSLRRFERNSLQAAPRTATVQAG